MAEFCIICGARLSDSNPDGIGCECRAALRKAQKDLFLSDENNRLQYFYGIECRIIRGLFLSLFAGVNFRNDFRKSFYASVANSERLSKKQLSICVDMIFQKDANNNFWHEVQTARDAFLNQAYEMQVTAAAVEIARKEIRKNKKN